MSFSRYEAYRDSGIEWLGAVPAHWRVVPLLAVAAERDEPNEGMREQNLLSLSYGRVIRRDLLSNDGLLPESFETYQIVEPGDTVLRLTDLQNDQRSLRSALVEERGIITSAYLALAPKQVEPRFLSYLLRSYDLRKIFYSMGGGLRQSMKFADLKRLRVLIPSVVEQNEIATFLDRETDKVDAIISEQQRLIALLTAKRQATMSRGVTKGINPDVPMKDSGIEWLGNVPAHWDVRRVKSVSTFITSGPRGWSDRISDDGMLFIQSGDLNDRLEIEFESVRRVKPVADAEAARTRLQDGDVVVCITGAKTGNVAACALVPEPAYVNQHLCLVRPSPDVSSTFLAAMLKSHVGQTHFRISQYGLKQGLSLNDVAEAPVLVPAPQEQVAIVAWLAEQTREIDRLVFEARRAIALLQERRGALISAAVTGQINVRAPTASVASEMATA